MEEQKIKVLALLPMELPKEIELDNTLEAMQKFVGGLIECITLRDTGSEVTLLHFKHEDFHRTESGAYLIGGCKTEAGRNRIIPILDFGIPVFEHAYATSVENGPLFPNGKGGFWNEKNWRNRKFYPFLEEIGIQPNPYDENGKRKPEFAGKLATYTPYTTRHTYASLCDRAGVNKDILKRAVGHTPKSKTLDEVYLHPKATQMIEAFDKANQLVNDEVLTTTKA